MKSIVFKCVCLVVILVVTLIFPFPTAFADGETIDFTDPAVKQEMARKIIETKRAAADNYFNKKEFEQALDEMKKLAPNKLKSHQAAILSNAVGTMGDILITYDTNTSGWNHGHAAIVMWDNSKIIEAVPKKGVRIVPNNWKTTYHSKRGFWIKGAEEDDWYAQNFAHGKEGKPYSIATSKKSMDKYYCSKLVWQAWHNKGFDTDCNGGVMVTPADIDKDPDTVRFL